MAGCEHGVLRVERFAAAPVAPASGTAENDEFIVELARSGKRVRIAPGVSIATALQDEGVYVPTSCEQGICGACQIGYLSGTPDHRDLVLLDEERKSYLMACCARSLTPELVLDL
jgi:vanillate O-demethylase ferredoxin subunit